MKWHEVISVCGMKCCILCYTAADRDADRMDDTCIILVFLFQHSVPSSQKCSSIDDHSCITLEIQIRTKSTSTFFPTMKFPLSQLPPLVMPESDWTPFVELSVFWAESPDGKKNQFSTHQPLLLTDDIAFGNNCLGNNANQEEVPLEHRLQIVRTIKIVFA